jgi:hypothetical protein
VGRLKKKLIRCSGKRTIFFLHFFFVIFFELKKKLKAIFAAGKLKQFNHNNNNDDNATANQATDSRAEIGSGAQRGGDAQSEGEGTKSSRKKIAEKIGKHIHHH